MLSLPWSRLKLADRVLVKAERSIALISRCQPRNAQSEQKRLLGAWQAGRKEEPRWTYAAVPDMSALRRSLVELRSFLKRPDPISRLYCERASELELETEIVEAIATRELRNLAARRFRTTDSQLARRARQLATYWARLTPPPEPQPGVVSDEATNRESLYSRMCQTVGEMRLPVRVELSGQLLAAAATGQSVILVARGRRLTRPAAERIVVHEVLGHALPRCKAAQQSLGLFSVGSARGNDEQEGYALLLEQRTELMDAARKRELGLRHLAVLSVHEGASWSETVSALLELGAELAEAQQIAARVHRAGGLAREGVYLPALCRVEQAIARDPRVEDWLSCGRLSLDAITTLRERCEVELRFARAGA